jgi:hypothetical protein
MATWISLTSKYEMANVTAPVEHEIEEQLQRYCLAAVGRLV